MSFAYSPFEIAQAISSPTSHFDSCKPLISFSIDSRHISPNSLFFCIKGHRTDGHLYAKQAIENGASYCVANPNILKAHFPNLDIPLIAVDDPNQALMKFGAFHRKHLKESARIIGVTGSAGKTSMKNMLFNLCKDLPVSGTIQNFNNFIGTPISMLHAKTNDDFWFIEMGTNQHGEIATLSQMVKPHLAIITSIGEAHLEFLKSTENVAREKASIIAGMDSAGILLVPDDLKHFDIVKEIAGTRKIETYGHSSKADYRIESLQTDAEQTTFTISGEQFVTSAIDTIALENMAGSLASLHLLGRSWQELKHQAKSVHVQEKGRMHFMQIQHWTVVDSTYNSNPCSLKKVVDSLQVMYPKHRIIAILGEMAELGEQAVALHQECGHYLAQRHVVILALGEELAKAYIKKASAKTVAKSFQNLDDLIDCLLNLSPPESKHDLILVKGSLSASMDKVIDALCHLQNTL